ncbi:MAG: T9SS type A sorting domain-containing protein [Salinivirgaceae bacterium]|nr:T9SS type A sorting domain-containing protein [Salinivirgaceae bacterium]
MKKLTILLMMFIASLSILKAQSQIDLPVSFDDPTGYDYTLTDFGNNSSVLGADPDDATNTVAITTKPTGAQTWAGTTLGSGFASAIPFSATEKTMTVKVYSPTSGTVIRLKVEDAANSGIFCEVDASTTGINTWEVLTFDFDSPAGGSIDLANTYDKASIFFDFNNAGNDAVYYWDDVTFVAVSVSPTTDVTLSDLQVDNETPSDFSASKTIYTVDLVEGTTTVPTVTATPTQAAPAAAVVTPAAAIPGTTTIEVTAQDGTTKKIYQVAFVISIPATAAPTPPARAIGDSISIFCNASNDLPGTVWDANWGESTVQTIIDIAGNSTMSYKDFTFQGINFATPFNATAMDYLHVDMWTNDATVVKVTPISGGEVLVPLEPIVAGEWKSYDIPIEDFTGLTLDNIGQFKFDGQAGVSPSYVHLDNIYFWKEPDLIDVTLSNLTLDGTPITGFNKNLKKYTVDLVDGTTVPTVAATTTDAAANLSIIQASATLPDTAIIAITGSDGTTKDTVRVIFAYTIPAAAAPTPPARAIGDSISIYCNASNDVAGTLLDATWSNSDYSEVSLVGNQTIKLANLNYHGIELSPDIDASKMDYLHIDMWTADAPAVNAFCISSSSGEKSKSLTITEGEWVSYDIPMSYYTNLGMTISDLFQFKFDGASGKTVYLDNIYFWRPPIVSNATLSDLLVDGTTIDGFGSAKLTNTVGLVEGTTTVPTITATATNDGNAAVVITPAATISDTTYVVVTSEDATITKTYKVAYAITIPAAGAPTPTQIAANVISIYSDTYTDVAGTNFDASWSNSDYSAESIAGNAAIKLANLAFHGMEISSDLDASTMNMLHVDMWTNDATVMKVTPISTSTGEHLVSMTPITAGSWNSFNIPLSEFTGLSFTDIKQFKFDGQTGVSPSNIYLDNIYFFNAPGSTDATLSDLKVNAASVTGFDAATLSYAVKLPVGTTAIPVVAATATDAANAAVAITQATSPNGTASVLVTAENGIIQKTYTINFTVPVAQVLPVTFESGPYDITNFEGGVLTVISNLQTTGNASANVAQIVKGTGSGAAGSILALTSDIDFSLKPEISMKVYSPRVGATLKFKLQGSGGATEKDATSTVANAWETFTFDFTGTASDTFNEMVFMFDYGTPGDGSANYTFLVDDIEQTGTTANTDATLSAIALSQGTLSPAFDAATIAYTVELPYGTTIVPTVTATATDATNATVDITADASVPGASTVLVTAEDGTTTKTYTVTFTIAAPSTTATLADLLVEALSIEGFKSDSVLYKVEAPFGTTVFPTVTCTLADTTATVVETQAPANTRTATVVVTAQDGTTTKTYTVEFVIAAANTDASLSDLLLNDVTIKGFKTDTLNYKSELPFGTTSAPVVTATSTDTNAVVVVTQAALVTDTAIIVVTAQDGTTAKTYSIAFSVSQFISTDASLRDIKVNKVSLADFDSAKMVYSVELPFGTTAVPSVVGITNNMAATVVMDTAKTLADTAVITVTAQDGISVLTYRVLFKIADPVYNVTFTVSSGAKSLLEGAEVVFMLDTLTTSINGTAVFTQVSVTTDAAYSVTLDGYEDVAGTLSVVDADVAQAISMKLKAYDVKFNVVDAANKAIAVAEVVFQNDTTTTDSTGMALFSSIVPVSDAAYSVSKAGYFAKADTLSVVDSAVVENISLELEAYAVNFSVIGADSIALAMANVIIGNDTVSTDSTGLAMLTVVPGKMAYAVSKEGYITVSDSVVVTDSAVDVSVMLEMPIAEYTITFTVVDGEANAVADAEIAILGETLTTNAEGRATIESAAVSDEAYTITKEGYVEGTGNVTVVDTDVAVNVTLEVLAAATYTVTFTVIDAESNAIADAEVVFNGASVTTDANGLAEFAEVAPVTDAEYSVSKDGFEVASGNVSVVDDNVNLNVQLMTVGLQNAISLVTNIYPNPTNGELNIQLAKNIEKATFELYDGCGKIVVKTVLNQMETILDLGDNKQGIYFIRVTMDNQQYFGKVLINE